MITYKIEPIYSGTRLRVGHSVFDDVITSFGPGDVLTCDEKWVAPADGAEVKAGDMWFHVISKNDSAISQTGWTAYIHKGVPICKNLQTIDSGDVVDPDPIDADVYITIRDSVVTGVTVNGETWEKPEV